MATATERRLLALGRHGDLGAHTVVGDRVRPRAPHAALGRGRDVVEGGRGPAAPRRAARLAHRPAQPSAHRRPHRARAVAVAAHGHAARPVLHRPRRPQAGQRHAPVAAPRGRRAHHLGRGCDPREPARHRHPRPPRRRRVRRDLRGRRRRGHRARPRRPHPRRGAYADPDRRRDRAGRREHRRRHPRRARVGRAAAGPRRRRDVPRQGGRRLARRARRRRDAARTRRSTCTPRWSATSCACTTGRWCRWRPARCWAWRP